MTLEISHINPEKLEMCFSRNDVLIVWQDHLEDVVNFKIRDLKALPVCLERSKITPNGHLKPQFFMQFSSDCHRNRLADFDMSTR